MGRSEPLVDRRASGKCRGHQRGTRRIAARLERGVDVGDHAGGTVERERIDHRIGGFGEEALDAVRERVDPGGSDQAAG